MAKKIAPQRSKMFAEEYIKNGMNSTAALKAIEGENALKHSENYLRVKAHRTLHNLDVQRDIEVCLHKAGVHEDFISGIIYRNAKQQKNYSASNQAIDIATELLKLKEKDTQNAPVFNIVVRDMTIENTRKRGDVDVSPPQENPV